MEIDILKLLRAFIKRWWLILIGLILCGAITFIYISFFVTELYTSTSTLYVVNSSDSTALARSYSDIYASQQLAKSYIQIMDGATVTSMVTQQMNGKYSASEINKMVEVSVIDETEILQIVVMCPDASDAQKITQLFVKNGTEEFKRIIKVSGSEVVVEATLPTSPSYPDKNKYAILGAIFGMILACIIIAVNEIYDTRVKTEEDFKSVFNIPVIGIIPKM